ncbi:MAG TPA: cyanophycin synthetase [Gemmatimonadales bacterium]|nr:cyanophycin synthetase [Gemmatimonadales bacterium]
MDLLGHPERHYPTIHVGGTNGKGSTCAFLTAELRARGFKVGLYTSPHLVSATERIVVDGVPISEDAFAQWTETLRPHIERLDASFFECLTAIAFADFAARGVDIAVIEVGLGGRLDATNVITPLVSVVSKIALEHTDYLGPDLVSIAREKAGIAKPGVPFVTGEQDPRILQVLKEEASLRGANPIIAVPQSALRIPHSALGLKGPHQRQNAAVARAALRVLPEPFGLPGADIPASFAEAFIPGRFEVRGSWIFDVAHNPDGMEILVAALEEARPRRPVHALVGIRNDKEWRPMLERILPAVDRLILTVAPTVPAQQRWLARDLAGWADERVIGQPVVFEPDFPRALEIVQEGAATTLVTGSFHTVGDALAALPGFAPVG